MAWLWHTRLDELAYHTWKQPILLDLGDAIDLVSNRDQVSLNSHVSLTGILGNKAATLSGLRAGSFRYGRFQVRQLLGSKLYVEYDEEKYHKKFNPFTRIRVSGRITSFGAGSELEKVRTFFKNYYNQAVDENALLLVVDESPRSELRYGFLFAGSIALLLFSFYASAKSFRRSRKD